MAEHAPPAGERGGAEKPLASFAALGTAATVSTTDPHALEDATVMLREQLDELDRACSRFRSDSEVWELARAGGRTMTVSPLLAEALTVAVDSARITGGAVDPTVGQALVDQGYDRDFAELARGGSAIGAKIRASSRRSSVRSARPVPGWWRVEVDRDGLRARVPAGTLLDLGATAKALAADRAASSIARRTRSGVLVSIGGDVAVAGPVPRDGWPIGIATSSSTPVSEVDLVVSIFSGGLASSSTSVRTWRRRGRLLHHIVDPDTGTSVEATWVLVSVAAPSCVAANTASTAAVVWGPAAAERLRDLGLPARLVAADGSVSYLGGWPEDPRSTDHVAMGAPAGAATCAVRTLGVEIDPGPRR